jgi:hypothetical protein
MADDEPLAQSGIAQFVKHDRCPRYIKQRADPGNEPDTPDWREAFGLINIALLGNGQEFEANQLERLAADVTNVIAPELDDQTKAGMPDIPVDETWADSLRGHTAQLTAGIDHEVTPHADGAVSGPLGEFTGEETNEHAGVPVRVYPSAIVRGDQ